MTDQKLSDISNHLTFSGTTRLYGVNGTTAGYSIASDVLTYVDGNIDYESPLTFSTGLTRTSDTVTVDTAQNITVLSNLTTNGLVKTTGGTGALSIDTTTYTPASTTVNGHALSSNVSISASDLSTGTLAAARGGAGTVSGLMKANGSGTVSAATSGTDYAAGTAALATGILKSTTATGALTIATAGDFPTLNQNTTGSAATLTTPRSIYGNNFDGSAALTQIIAPAYGGTGNGFVKFTGPATAEKTFTLPNVNSTIMVGSTGSTDNVLLRADGTGGATMQATGVTVSDANEISGFQTLVVTETTTARTLASTDTGTTIRTTNGSAVTITLPNSLTTGFTVEIIQDGAGQITFSPASGASINNRQTQTKTYGQYSTVRLVVVSNSGGSNAVYNLAGDTGA